jgi:drug/metabolite transporter (DMT)-like permease
MIYLLLVSIAWAFSFGLIKGNLAGVDSNFVSFARMAFSLLVFLPFLKYKKLNRRKFLLLALDGFLQFGIMYIAYTASFNYLKAYEVALFTIFTPIYVTLIDDAFNREFNPNFLMSALMAVAGTYIIEVGQAVNSGIWWGFLLVQISNLGFAFGQVFYRRLMADEAGLKDRDVFGALYLGAFVGTGIVTLIFTPLASLHLSLTHWWTLIYLGVFASGICFFLWNLGARKVNAGALAIFNDLKIPLSISVSILVFGEKANLTTLLIGGGIIVLSLVLNEISVKRKAIRSALTPGQPTES